MDIKGPIFAGAEVFRQPAPPLSPPSPNYFILMHRSLVAAVAA
jgi:hypothetical protein